MTDETTLSGAAAAGRNGLATQLRDLEAYLADSEAAGNALPPEATEMVARLRELVRALDGLAATFAVTVSEVTAPGDVEEVRRLVLEYASAHADTPGVEHMRADAAALPGPYTPPRGGLWLARAGDVGVGCVALRPRDAGIAEVKRMYVDPTARGNGVGRALLEALIAGARARGYETLRLGTLEDMTAAQGLYRSLGFEPIPRYRPDELIDTRFYELPLQAPLDSSSR
jgi:ribosomal protein S18 acetylase RimI-like enzyme